MSYQIKSTPYFRRLVSISKKNGQLQRLREEYERVNDLTDVRRMRQVRLTRLYRHIEEIRDVGSTLLAASGRHQQLEAVGRETSIGNGKLSKWSEVRVTSKMQADAEREAIERRERAAKRISYGNAQSKQNMRRLSRRQWGIVAAGGEQAETDSLQLIQRARLEKRLLYGNSCSSNNIKRSLRLSRLLNSDQGVPTAPLAPADQPSQAVPKPRTRAAAYWHLISLTLPWFRALSKWLPKVEPAVSRPTTEQVFRHRVAYYFQDDWPQRVCGGWKLNREPSSH